MNLLNQVRAIVIIMLGLTASSNHSSAQIVNADYQNTPRHVIKFEFFSPLTGNATFGYEHVLSDWISFEGKVGIIGAGKDITDNNSRGVFLKAGPKIRFTPAFVTEDTKGTAYLQGGYFRPELIYSAFQTKQTYYGYYYDPYGNPSYEEASNFNHSFALMLNFGKQWLLANRFTIDIHTGIGYGFTAGSGSTYDVTEQYKFSHVEVGSDFPLAFSSGFMIGYAF